MKSIFLKSNLGLKIHIMKKISLFILIVCLVPSCAKSEKYPAVRSLIERVIPGKASSFLIDSISPENGLDVFELESVAGKIVVRGSSPTAAAYAVNYYLNHYCNCQFTQIDEQLNMPDILPEIPQKIHIASPYKYRYNLNYCTFNYTASFWGWEEWQRELDWMALHGINLALAMNGMEAVWQNTLQNFNFSDKEIKDFIPGPCYQSWWLMGNFEKFGGPVTQQWIDSRSQLQKKVVSRMRELGIEPVMQAFYGVVPLKLQEKYPTSKIYDLKYWPWDTVGFRRLPFLDPADSLFPKMAKVFYDEQKKLYGPAKFFIGDPLHEHESNEGMDLTRMATSIQETMLNASPGATWLLTVWLNKPDDLLIDGTSVENTLYLDLTSNVYKQRDGFKGHNFIWCNAPNFGGGQGIKTQMNNFAKGPVEALKSKYGSQVKGIGMMMEGINNMPYAYELTCDMAWRTEVPDINEWFENYMLARYGKDCPPLKQSRKLLLATVLNDNHAEVTNGVIWGDYKTLPSLNQPCFPKNLEEFDKAVALFASCAGEFKNIETYRFDLVDLMQQSFTHRLSKIYYKIDNAIKSNNVTEFDKLTSEFNNVLLDFDLLLSTYKSFMLGSWVEAAKNAAPNENEKALYEWNAKTLITAWGDEKVAHEGSLLDYASRRWAGMMKDYYLPRWKLYFDNTRNKMLGKPGIAIDYYNFSDNWARENKTYPTEPVGDPVEVSLEMIKKYRIGMQ
jgi:alpha-N-acetylglucosaminidase